MGLHFREIGIREIQGINILMLHVGTNLCVYVGTNISSYGTSYEGHLSFQTVFALLDETMKGINS